MPGDVVSPVTPTREAERPFVLIAGTSPSWTSRVRSALGEAPLALEVLGKGALALERIESAPDEVALVVLEGMLEDMSGLAFCRRLRESESGAGPLVLLVSPFGDEMDRVLSFECGVDDFAQDPFFPRELASRVQALLRRGRRPRVLSDEGEARLGPLRIDFRKSLVELDGHAVPLTWREFEVLRLLAQERGRVVRRAALLGLLLGAPDAASPRLIDTYVKSIRRKLGAAGSLIETVRGVGYRLSAG
jgi:two-component system phosphate regulon response regulator PhoB